MATKRKPRKKRSGIKRKPAVYYDDALPLFAGIVLDNIGASGLQKNCFLRDADGNLTYVIREAIPASACAKIKKAVKSLIPTYVTALPLATPDDLLDDQLKSDVADRFEYVEIREGTSQFVRLVERRIVGQDWISGIWPPIEHAPPIVVFASQKGGVGRSTALAVAATDLARQGYSILAIDADLEAPGLGEMFIPEDSQPTFGALDYFVENGRGTVTSEFLDGMRAPSALTRGRGKVWVVPAVGKKCRTFPQNVIGKISRAYLEDVEPNGSPQTLLQQMRTMIKDLTRRHKYDAIFVDARAGLNETTAATVQGLGADILFFGVDTPQTWDGYRYFMSHLARFKSDAEEDWRYRLKMVHAKATDLKSLAAFRDNSFELFAEHLYDEIDETMDLDQELFGFDVDDQAAPHYAWPIMMDRMFYEFDPIANPHQLNRKQYTRAFGKFVSQLIERLKLK